MNHICVSIIVPCYKAQDHLAPCLDSLIGQTFTDIEIICINDGSPDNTLSILRDYEHLYPNKVVVIDKHNEGVWKARRDGIRKARGNYIGFLDSDDYAEPNFVKNLYNAAKKANADLVIGGFSRTDMYSHACLTHEMCRARPSFRIEKEPGRLVELNGSCWNKLFRAEALKSTHDLADPPEVMEDLLFQMLIYLNMSGEAIFVPQSLVRYMVHADSAINTVSIEKLDAGYRAFLQTRTIYETSGASDALLEALDAIAFEHLGVSMMFRLSCNKDIDLGQQLIRCRHFLDQHFPTWRHNSYINLGYASAFGGAFVKLNIAQKMFRAHLMRPFLAIYRFAITRLHIDIKW